VAGRRFRARGEAPHSPQSLGKLLSEVYPKDAPDDSVVHRLAGCWASVVSERIQDNAQPVAYRAGVLSVNTTTASWANALSAEASQLLTRLGARLPGVPLTRLAFRVGRLPALPERERRELPPPDLLPIDALPEEVAIELARIASDGVRDRVAHAMAATLAEAKPQKGARRGFRKK
jgi:hypothetical protein